MIFELLKQEYNFKDILDKISTITICDRFTMKWTPERVTLVQTVSNYHFPLGSILEYLLFYSSSFIFIYSENNYENNYTFETRILIVKSSEICHLAIAKMRSLLLLNLYFLDFFFTFCFSV